MALSHTSLMTKSQDYKSREKYKYAKNNPDNFKIMTTYGSMESALRYAETKRGEYTDSRYANHNPCTTVYRLVRQILGQDEELNAELTAKIEG